MAWRGPPRVGCDAVVTGVASATANSNRMQLAPSLCTPLILYPNSTAGTTAHTHTSVPTLPPPEPPPLPPHIAISLPCAGGPLITHTPLFFNDDAPPASCTPVPAPYTKQQRQAWTHSSGTPVLVT